MGDQTREATHVVERLMKHVFYMEKERYNHRGGGYYDRIWWDENNKAMDKLLEEFDEEMRCADCGKVRDAKKRLSKG